MRSDLAWWELFLETWNGVSLLRPNRLSTPDYEVFTDASGLFGCGAVWEHTWLQLKWPVEYREVPIAPKELVPIVVACTVWGKDWSGKVVHVYSDNEAVVAVVNSGYSKDTQLMHLTRCLFFVLAAWDIALHASLIPGVLNTAADTVSRNNLSIFFSAVQGANPVPAVIPRELGELLMTRQPDWTEESWRTLFRSCLSQVWHHPPRRPTDRGSTTTSVFVLQSRSLHSQPRNLPVKVHCPSLQAGSQCINNEGLPCRHPACPNRNGVEGPSDDQDATTPIRAESNTAGRQGRTRLPITPEILEQLRRV